MHTVVKLITAIALLGALGACAQFGQAGNPDLALYETSLSD